MPQPSKQIQVNGHPAWGMKVRQRIDSAKIVERLQRVACGEEEATQTSINAARILLDRTLPTIAAIQVKPDGGQDAKTITNEDLFRVIEGQAKRIEKK